jgi:hypothetical protein
MPKTTLCSSAGLPDGIFSYQKCKFGSIFEGLAMEDVGIFYGHPEHSVPFGKVCVHFVLL